LIFEGVCTPGPSQDANAGPSTLWACCNGAIFLVVVHCPICCLNFSELLNSFEEEPKELGSPKSQKPRRDEGKQATEQLGEHLRRMVKPGLCARLGGKAGTSTNRDFCCKLSCFVVEVT
jgi:hypothetical protein